MLFGTILCLGDSLTAGARAEIDAAGQGYPEFLASKLTSASLSDDAHSRIEWSILNKGVSGETTRQILDRAPAAFRELNSYPGPKWAVILAGTNDSKHPPTQEHPHCFADVTRLLTQIIRWGRRTTTPMIICTLPQVVPSLMPCYSKESMDFIREYNGIIRDMVKTYHLNPSPVYLCDLEEFIKQEHLMDGVHFNREGAELLARKITNIIKSLGREQ